MRSTTDVKRLAMLVILALTLALPLAAPALADVAPPLQPPASSIAPGEATQVQMVAETVVLEVLPPPDAGRVQVEARFTMRNQGGVEERMAVRFPLEHLSGMGDGYQSYPHIEGFAASVGGRPVPTRTVEEPPRVEEGETVSWAAFDVAFPAGEDVEIAVRYQTRLTGYHDPGLSGYNPASLYYILETGAGWQGPIGSAEIVLRLPYEAGPENVYLAEWTSPDGEVAGREVRWHYEGLEPTREDNWHASIVWPDDWLAIIGLRQAVADRPGDVEAWIDLAEAYLRVGSDKHGLAYSAPLAALSEATVEEALQRHPESAALHAERARVRWWRLREWEALGRPGRLEDPAVQGVLAEAEAALSLDPQYVPALAVRREVLAWVGITPTPRPVPTFVASVTPARPTATPHPTATPAPAAPAGERAVAPGPAAWPLVLALALVLAFAPAAARRRR